MGSKFRHKVRVEVHYADGHVEMVKHMQHGLPEVRIGIHPGVQHLAGDHIHGQRRVARA